MKTNTKSIYQLVKKFMDFDTYEEIKFTQNWDSYLPVIEKIESLGFSVIIRETVCEVQRNGHSVMGFAAESKFLAVHNTIVAFIEWYNNQSK